MRYVRVSDFKMLFYKIIILIQILLVQVSYGLGGNALSEFQKLDYQLVKAVNQFQNDYNIGRVNTEGKSKVGFKNVPIEFINYENNLILILQQMAYLFDKQFETVLIQKEYILRVCSLLPRCLDYNFIGTYVNPKTVLLSRMYINFCPKMLNYIENVQSETNDANKKCLKEQMEKTLSTVKSLAEKETGITRNLFDNKEYNSKSNNYIRMIYNLINGFDMIPSIKIHISKADKNIFKDDLYNFDLTVNVRPNLDSVTPNFSTLNNEYAKTLRNFCGISSNELESNILKPPEVMKAIVQIILKELVHDFTSKINNGLITLTYKSNEDMDENGDILGMCTREISTNGVCKSISLILWYLIEMENLPDLKIFSLYLTLCGNFRRFNNNRCSGAFYNRFPESNSNEVKTNCVKESLKYIWAWNKYTITDKIPKVKHKSEHKKECIKIYLDFLSKYYEVINNFYTTKTVWTKIEWLSGRDFLTKPFKNADMNDLKTKEITVRGVTMSLSDAYDAILPWSLNIPAIMIFYNTLVHHLNKTMDVYAYRYFQLIISYLNVVGGSVDTQLSERINENFQWYLDLTKLFEEHLYLPFNTFSFERDEPENKKRDAMISLAEKIRANSCKNINEYIPKEDQKDLLRWSDSEDPSKRKFVVPFDYQFNDVIKRNCMNATDYVSTFVSIVKKSINMNFKYNAAAIQEKYCLKNMFNIEAPKNSPKKSFESVVPAENKRSLPQKICGFIKKATKRIFSCSKC